MTPSFFDDAAPAMNRPEPRAPWDTEVGHGVALSVLLARSRSWALTASGFVAYSSGFEFDVWLVRRQPLTSRGPKPLHPPQVLALDGETRLQAVGGGGGGGSDYTRFSQRYLGLPASGVLRLQIVAPEWAARTVEIDAALLLEAASRSVPSFPGLPPSAAAAART